MACSTASAPGDAVSAIRDWLVDERYLDSRVEHTITDAGPDARRVVFRITPGRRFERVELAFPGARGIEPTELEDIIKDQKLGPKVFTAPGTVTDLLQRFYREQGYLARGNRPAAIRLRRPTRASGASLCARARGSRFAT